nr:MAG TPA: hypothetical protein [Caudoviricetes sp.]
MVQIYKLYLMYANRRIMIKKSCQNICTYE